MSAQYETGDASLVFKTAGQYQDVSISVDGTAYNLRHVKVYHSPSYTPHKIYALGELKSIRVRLNQKPVFSDVTKTNIFPDDYIMITKFANDWDIFCIVLDKMIVDLASVQAIGSASGLYKSINTNYGCCFSLPAGAYSRVFIETSTGQILVILQITVSSVED
jgi:hypothetical protein